MGLEMKKSIAEILSRVSYTSNPYLQDLFKRSNNKYGMCDEELFVVMALDDLLKYKAEFDNCTARLNILEKRSE